MSSEISLGEFYDNEHVGPGSEKRTDSAARDDVAKTPLVRAFIPRFSLLKNEPMQPLFQCDIINFEYCAVLGNL